MYNFNLIKKENIWEIGSTAYVYDHRTGARLIYMENDDTDRVFSITFRTLPTSDCGLAHIMEHSVLCGSKNYRLKDPFNLLDKGSIHTYLNALTYEDKTLYPVGSTNETDFKTLMRVYLDAVFNPLIYENEGIFRQEGWHSDGSMLNGVVLNEMKGVMSSPMRVLDTAVNRELFKGCGYQYYSGGVPDSIPKLTYEEFLDFHREKYHPSNSVIYIYGKLNIEEYLKIIDEEFLSGYDYKKPVINKDFKLSKPKDVHISFPSKGKNILMAAYSFNTAEDLTECLAAEILCDVLCESEGAPIKTAVLQAGIGTSVSADFDDSQYLPCLELCVEGSEEQDAERLKQVIKDTLNGIKIDRHRIQGVINRIRFFFREQDFGYKPKGLFYNLLVLKSFLYGGESFDTLRLEKLFSQLDNYDWEALAQKMFSNGCYGVLHTDSQTEKKEAPVPPANNSSLLKYREFEDLPEEQEKIKTVPVKEIGRTSEFFDYKVCEKGLYVPVEDKGIVFASILFDTSMLTCDELSILGVYKSIVDLYDIDRYAQIDYYMGDFECGFTAFNVKDGFKPALVFGIKCLSENTEKSIKILADILETKFDDIPRIAQLMDEYREDVRLSYISSGAGSRAYRRALSGVSHAYAYADYVSGVNFYYALKNMTAEQFADRVKAVVKKLFTRQNMFYSLTCNSEDKNRAEKAINSLIYDRIDNTENKWNIFIPSLNGRNTGIISEADVNFNAAAFLTDCTSGVRKVVKQIISREYMWDKIRLIGGAYGGSAGFLWGRLCYLYSYRDPQIEKTYAYFDALGSYLEEIKLSKRELDRFIIGAVNEEDTPIKNGILNILSLKLYYSGTTEEKLNLRRCQMLDTTAEQIRDFGSRLKEDYKKAVIVTVGNEKAVNNYRKFEEFLQID